MKGVGMLVVSLRGINFGFWSHLGCSGRNAIIFSREGLVWGCTGQKYKNIYCLCFNMVSFRVQKSLGPAQIDLLQGFNSKFPTSIPIPFICGVPARGQKYILRLLQGLKGLIFRIVSFWSVVLRAKSFPANGVSLRKCSQVFEIFLSRPNKTQRLCYTNDKLQRKQMMI